MRTGVDSYPRAAVERAMKVHGVILRAMARKITWWQAAEIIGISDRQMRRSHPQAVEHARHTMTPGEPGLEIATAISTSADQRRRSSTFLPGLLANHEMAPRSNRHSGKPAIGKGLQTENLIRNRAKRIPSRPGVAPSLQ